jgi:hypothetical protein
MPAASWWRRWWIVPKHRVKSAIRLRVSFCICYPINRFRIFSNVLPIKMFLPLTDPVIHGIAIWITLRMTIRRDWPPVTQEIVDVIFGGRYTTPLVGDASSFHPTSALWISRNALYLDGRVEKTKNTGMTSLRVQ